LETNLNLFVLIGAAIIDSINPCAIGVLVFLLTYLVKTGKKSKGILIHGFIYLFAVFTTYLLAGLLLLPIIQSLRNFSVNAYLAIAAVVAFFGILELKEYFAPGATSLVEIPSRYSRMIEKAKEKMLRSPFFTFGMGVFVAIVELPCTGAVYLAILAIMSYSGLTLSNFTLLVLYNLIFIAPLILILVLFYRGTDSSRIRHWVKRFKPRMRLFTGLLLIGLAAWMVAFVLV
jgi:cytochrome c biogenesis protein CcdA